MRTFNLTFSPGFFARWWQVFCSRAVFCICKRKEMCFYRFTDGEPSLGRQGLKKVILFNRANEN